MHKTYANRKVSISYLQLSSKNISTPAPFACTADDDLVSEPVNAMNLAKMSYDSPRINFIISMR